MQLDHVPPITIRKEAVREEDSVDPFEDDEPLVCGIEDVDYCESCT